MTTADDRQADDERNTGEHRLSLAEWAVLCLVREKPAYGQSLAGLLDREGSLGRVWSVPKATLYRARRRLELVGRIRKAREQKSSDGGPARRVLEVTPAGQLAVQAWLSTPVSRAAEVRSQLMIKLALLDRTGADSRVLVRAQLALLLPIAAALDTCRALPRDLSTRRPSGLSRRQATVKFLQAQMARHIAGSLEVQLTNR